MSRFSGLGVRLISAAVLIPLAIAWNMSGGVMFTIGLSILSSLLVIEWWRITKNTGFVISAAGFPYVLLTCFCLLQIRLIHLPDHGALVGSPHLGRNLIFGVIGLLAAVDVGGYIFGKLIGGKKLAPSISPNKTWAGLIGAMACCGLTTAILQVALPAAAYKFSFFEAFLLGAILAVIAQMGDLLESWLKRLAGVKDAGGLIPGHGGLLDRMDGYLAAVPFFYLWCAWQGWA